MKPILISLAFPLLLAADSPSFELCLQPWQSYTAIGLFVSIVLFFLCSFLNCLKWRIRAKVARTGQPANRESNSSPHAHLELDDISGTQPGPQNLDGINESLDIETLDDPDEPLSEIEAANVNSELASHELDLPPPRTPRSDES